ncbi:MAG: SPFH/Band 7/PHB domain protein [Coleofasciculaceae cyanobacterium SM2_3_26]|nr:SPFH/Band 7/PHB domain protein [Coleofasciculaceae cyanobacterium SM2_3_26]
MQFFSISAFFLGLTAIFLRFSVHTISERNKALVEYLGSYKRTLDPGLRFIIPFVERVVCVDTISEKVLDIPEQQAITADNVAIEIDAVVYWQILDLFKSYYEIDRLELAIQNLVNTKLRNEVGRMRLSDVITAGEELNRIVLEGLDEITGGWGVKILRVQVQHVTPDKDVLESMEREQAAEIEKRAEILRAEARSQSAVLEARASASALEEILRATGQLTPQPSSDEILKFLLVNKYVEAMQGLSQSPNAKVIFMDPQYTTEALAELMEVRSTPPETGTHPSGSGNGAGDM